MMRFLLPALALFACAGTVSAQIPLKDLEGKYTLKSASMNGKAAPQAFMDAIKEVAIGADSFTIHKTDGTDDTNPIKLDLAAKVATLDMLPKKDSKEKTKLGILKMEKGEVTLVVQRSADTKRPTEFKEGEGLMVLVLTKK